MSKNSAFLPCFLICWVISLVKAASIAMSPAVRISALLYFFLLLVIKILVVALACQQQWRLCGTSSPRQQEVPSVPECHLLLAPLSRGKAVAAAPSSPLLPCVPLPSANTLCGHTVNSITKDLFLTKQGCVLGSIQGFCKMHVAGTWDLYIYIATNLERYF